MPTIRDVAKEAGVSISTVSKVINKSSTISEATTLRVKQVMKDMHYYPNLRAKNFAQQITNNIIYIARIQRNSAFQNPHQFEIMCGIENALKKKGYNLSLVSFGDEESLYDIVDRIIHQKSADGIIIHASAYDPSVEKTLIQSKFPHILIGRPRHLTSLSWIDINNYISGELTAKHLIQLGHQTIAFVCGDKDDLISTHRFEGARAITSRSNTSLIHRYTDSTKEVSYDVAHQLLLDVRRPDAIICANNNIALGTVNALMEQHLRIPEDIAVITFDDFPYSRIFNPPLTVVNIDVFDIGLQAGKSLLKKIKQPELQIQNYSSSPTLIARGSTIGK